MNHRLIKLAINIILVFAFGLGIGFLNPELTIASPKTHNHSHEKVIAKEEIVYFNTKSLKYHKPSCEWAKKCTRNCISLSKTEAKARGGVPCKVCGG